MRKALLLLATASLVGASPAVAADRAVSIRNSAFSPRNVVALVGDTVTWTNGDFVPHTVTGSGIDSPRLGTGQGFSRPFPTAGRFSYHCSLHRGMTGNVTATAIWLEGPKRPILAGRRAVLTGLAAGESVRIERRSPDGTWTHVTEVVAAADGAFRATVAPTATTRYRALAGGVESAPATVAVRPKVVIGARTSGRAVVVRVSTTPARVGAAVTVQRYDRARFRWVALTRRRLDSTSQARLRLVPKAPMRVRAVVARGGGYAQGVSRAISIAR